MNGIDVGNKYDDSWGGVSRKIPRVSQEHPPSQLSPDVFVLFPLTVWVGVVVVSVQIPPLEGVGAVLSSQGCPNSWVALGVQARHRLLVFLGWVWEGGSHRCQLGRQGFHSCPRRWGDHLDMDIDVACQV